MLLPFGFASYHFMYEDKSVNAINPADSRAGCVTFVITRPSFAINVKLQWWSKQCDKSYLRWFLCACDLSFVYYICVEFNFFSKCNKSFMLSKFCSVCYHRFFFSFHFCMVHRWRMIDHSALKNTSRVSNLLVRVSFFSHSTFLSQKLMSLTKKSICNIYKTNYGMTICAHKNIRICKMFRHLKLRLHSNVTVRYVIIAFGMSNFRTIIAVLGVVMVVIWYYYN